MRNQGERDWHNGSEIEFTGRVVTANGAVWDEFGWLDGPRQGKTGVRMTAEHKATLAALDAEREKAMREGGPQTGGKVKAHMFGIASKKPNISR